MTNDFFSGMVFAAVESVKSHQVKKHFKHQILYAVVGVYHVSLVRAVCCAAPPRSEYR